MKERNSIDSQKGFFLIILGVLVLLAIVAAGAYYVGTRNTKTETQTQESGTRPTINSQSGITSPRLTPTITQVLKDETANWKTYTNDKYRILFKYPQGVELDTAPGNPTDWGKQIKITFRSQNEKVLLDVIAALTEEDLWYGRGAEGMKEISIDNIKMGSIEAEVKIAETDTTNPEHTKNDYISTSYWAKVKNRPLLIDYGGEKNRVSLQKLTQILSTFKFLD